MNASRVLVVEDSAKMAAVLKRGLDAGGDTVCLTILDTGAGFDSEFLPRAFEPFASGYEAQDGTSEGAGFGLAIVQAIALAHGGHATAENRPEGGARVRLYLPAS